MGKYINMTAEAAAGQIPANGGTVASVEYFARPAIPFRQKQAEIRRPTIVPEHSDIVRPAYTPDEFEGLNILITGLSHFDGFAYPMARRFVELGASSVVFVHRENSTEVNKLTAELAAQAQIAGKGTLVWPIQADISIPSDARSVVPEMLEETGTIDIYIDNAMTIAMGTLAKQSGRNLSERKRAKNNALVLNDLMTNVVGGQLILGDVAAAMQEQGTGGRVVSVISPGADGVGKQSRYAGAKAFKFAAMRCGAIEAAEDNFKGKKPETMFVSVAPGFAVTRLTDEAVPEKSRRGLLNIIGQERILTSDEVADYIIYASSRHLPEEFNGQVITAMKPMLDEAPVVEVQEAEVVDQAAEEPPAQDLTSGAVQALHI